MARPHRDPDLFCIALLQGVTDKVKDAANQAKGAAKDAAGAVKGKVASRLLMAALFRI